MFFFNTEAGHGQLQQGRDQLELILQMRRKLNESIHKLGLPQHLKPGTSAISSIESSPSGTAWH